MSQRAVGVMDKDEQIAELKKQLQWYKSTKFPVRFRIRDLLITIDRVEEIEEEEQEPGEVM